MLQEFPDEVLINSCAGSKFPYCYKSIFFFVAFCANILQEFPCSAGLSASHIFYILCIYNDAIRHLLVQARHKAVAHSTHLPGYNCICLKRVGLGKAQAALKRKFISGA